MHKIFPRQWLDRKYGLKAILLHLESSAGTYCSVEYCVRFILRWLMCHDFQCSVYRWKVQEWINYQSWQKWHDWVKSSYDPTTFCVMLFFTVLLFDPSFSCPAISSTVIAVLMLAEWGGGPAAGDGKWASKRDGGVYDLRCTVSCWRSPPASWWACQWQAT